ncbi:MAG: tail fiber domain-containing protein [Bacteroidetes bacterium]|nr:tail fiber domain-containing protein [Bacteroidota bacterium]
MEVASQGTLNNILFRYNGTAGPNFTFQSANGTLSAPTALLSSNILGRINFSGYNGSSYINTAMIRALTEADAIGFTPPRSRMDFLVSQGAYMVEGISITGDLRVGIMENDPQTTLHVGIGADAERTVVQSGFFMLGDETATNILMDNNEIMARNGTAISPLYFQVDGGNVGIGNTGAPAFQLELSLNSAGKPTSTLWTVSSDLRLKKDIRPYEGGLKEIMQINPVWFRYNGVTGLPTEELGVGTIAQELEKVAPYMIKPYIKEDDKGNKTEYKSVDYNAMLFMFVNAFKEQQQKIDALQQQLDLLRKN